jgi:NagD protein
MRNGRKETGKHMLPMSAHSLLPAFTKSDSHFGDRAAAAIAALASIRHIVLDLDGTLYRGNMIFDETLPFLDTLRRLQFGFTFLTNNATRSRRDYLAHLRKLGIPAAEGQLYSSAHATLRYLRQELPHVRRLLVLGTASLGEEFLAAGYRIVGNREAHVRPLATMDAEDSGDTPQAVIVSGDATMSFSTLCCAAWWIARGLPYLATHPDATCPTDQPESLLLDCGAICAALAAATGRQPDKVTGKPDPLMLQAVLEEYGLRPSEVAVVGDRLNTDMALARNAGAIGILVLTGSTDAATASASPQPPDLVLPHLGHLSRLLADVSGRA